MNNEPTASAIKYLALGDSYTIGESVPATDRFPMVLIEKLRTEHVLIDDPKIIATTGWTTDELIQAIEQDRPTADWDLVTLLIGVNNEYRNYPFSQYEREFVTLLDQAINFAQNDPSQVIVLSIPDYAFTPFGQGKDPDKITSTLKLYNGYAKEVCEKRNIKFLNITDFTQQGLHQPEYVASDGLHPSGLMYRLWIDEYYNTFKKAINK